MSYKDFYTADEFEETFKPFYNDEQYMFDTYDDMTTYLKANKKSDLVNSENMYQHVWTAVDGDSGNTILINGFHFVNKIGYVFCQVPWGTGELSDKEIYIEAEY